MNNHEIPSIMIQMNVLNAIMLLTAILSLAFRRVRSQISSYAVQSFALTLICALMAGATGGAHIYFVAFLTFFIKCVTVPYFLAHISHKISVTKDTEKFFAVPTAVLISGLLIIFSYYVMLPLTIKLEPLTRGSLNTSVSLILIGLFLMMNRTFALTQVLGILIIENGLFLAGIATTHGMPLFIELGIFFDMIVGVVLMGILTNRISDSFETLDTNKLNLLKH